MPFSTNRHQKTLNLTKGKFNLIKIDPKLARPFPQEEISYCVMLNWTMVSKQPKISVAHPTQIHVLLIDVFNMGQPGIL